MRIVLGLDVDSKQAHFSIWNGREVVDKGILFGQAYTKHLKARWDIDCAYIEDVPYCKNQRTVIAISQAIGRVQQQLVNAHLPYRMINVSTWKSVAVGDGKASKEKVRNIVHLSTNLDKDEPQDIFDATAIAIAGYQLEGVAGGDHDR